MRKRDSFFKESKGNERLRCVEWAELRRREGAAKCDGDEGAVKCDGDEGAVKCEDLRERI